MVKPESVQPLVLATKTLVTWAALQIFLRVFSAASQAAQVSSSNLGADEEAQREAMIYALTLN
jgi:hypothetical protein